jgi:putative ABC transport system permease protein
MFKNYLKTAFRTFRKHKIFTFINVIGLSIGISASLVIFLIVHHDFTFDQFHKDSNRIYRVVSDYNYAGTAFYNSGVCGPLPDAIKNDITGVEISAPVYSQDYKVLIPGKVQKKFKDEENLAYTDQRYFDIFSYKWIVGTKKVLNQPNQVVLTSQQAKKYFPSLSYEEMLGKQVVYNDSIRTTVAGIVAEFKDNTDFTFTDFISYKTIQGIKDLRHQQSDWTSTNGNSMCFLLLSPQSTVAGIERQLGAMKAKYAPNPPGGQGYQSKFSLQPLNDIHFNEKYGAMRNPAANKTTLYGLIAIGAFLLLLGCINFVNLTTAQASQRAKEIGVRKTMGGSRVQLIGQFFSETTLLTVVAVIVSIAITPLVMKLFSDFISKDIKAELLISTPALIFIVLLILIVSFFSGFYPAIVLSKYQPIQVLKNQAYTGTSKTRNSFLRKSLTVTQFVIAQFFIMATILVSKQIYYALHKDLGFKKNAIVYVDLPWVQKTAGLREVFANKVKALPQVEMVSLGNDVPSSGGWSSNDATYHDGKKEIHSELYHKSGDENYINVYKIKLITGRNIRQSDTSKAMLVNATYAHLLGFKNVANAIGKTIEFGKTERREIVGIVADFHQATLHAPIKPMAIYPDSYGYGQLHIALKPETAGGNEWKTTLAGIEQAWKEVYPADDYAYHFFDESIAKMYDKEQHISSLLSWATGLSVFISCLGLLGLAIFTTNLRTKEIGVRKVLGATVTQIVTLLSTELMMLILLSFVVATPVAWYVMNKWMQDFADRTPISWWIFILSGAGMLLTALFTLSFQTIKAAIANPVKSLKTE